MAFGFAYTIKLVIIHPAMDVEKLTNTFRNLVPTMAVSAGDVRTFRSGLQRPAELSVWTACLHSERELDSDTVSLSQSLGSCLLDRKRLRAPLWTGVLGWRISF